MLAKLKRTLVSVKFWALLFSMFVIAFIVIADRKEFLPVAQLLCFVIFAYLPCNVVQKAIEQKKALLG